MSLTIDEITALSRDVAAGVDPKLHVVAVVSNDRESSRVELLITIDGCHREPCALVLNLPRGERAAIELALRKQLTDTIRQHVREA